MDEQIMVSINCLVYNHEKYLRQCLDGMVNQKTNFKYEILIHDDASTDKSPEIIREYVKKYPYLFKAIFQAENQHSKKVPISIKLQYPRARGKYIAMCEGDDFWTDDTKLQKQFDAMEANPDAAVCVHKVNVVREDGQTHIMYLPYDNINTGKMNADYLFNNIFSKRLYSFQTSSYFFRTDYAKMYSENLPEYARAASVGDIPLLWYLILKGSLVYIDEEMSCYRRGAIGSFSSGNRNKAVHDARTVKFIRMVELYNEYSGYEYDKYMKQFILDREFESLNLHSDYRHMRQEKYSARFGSLSFKDKLRLILCDYLPFCRILYEKRNGIE